MKKIFILALLSVFYVPAFASVTTTQMTDPEYVINSGYSQATAEEIVIEKNRKQGKFTEPLFNAKHNTKFVNFLRNVYGYVDSSVDTDQRYHHDIHMSPSWKDL